METTTPNMAEILIGFVITWLAMGALTWLIRRAVTWREQRRERRKAYAEYWSKR